MDKGNPARVIFHMLILALLLIGLPYASWYYLTQGINFRKDQLSQISEKTPLDPETLFTLAEQAGIEPDSLRNRVLLFVFPEGHQGKDLEAQLSSLNEQFGGQREFRALVFSSNAAGGSPGIRYENWDHFIQVKLNREEIYTAPELKELGFNFDPDPPHPVFALADMEGNIRRYYSEEEKEQLVIHIAMLLPAQKREEVELMREEEI